MRGTMGGVRILLRAVLTEFTRLARLGIMTLALLLALAPTATSAIFDDGNDRHLVKELRAKKPSDLTDEERAILAAANKLGSIGLCGRFEGNASLIRHRACPANGAAVLTSAHLFMDDRGKLKPECTGDNIRKARYIPNVSYYRGEPKADKWITKQIGIQSPPVNFSEIEGR
jgi:hypothetical protein